VLARGSLIASHGADHIAHRIAPDGRRAGGHPQVLRGGGQGLARAAQGPGWQARARGVRHHRWCVERARARRQRLRQPP
jgi:hypothetical protein